MAASAAERYSAGFLGFDRPSELQRLRLRQQVMDPWTQEIIRARGIAPDWRCLELGAGTGSVARWLASVCVEGHVVATDVDLRWLEEDIASNLEVVRHDVVTEDLPVATGFDLIHARSLLANLPEREQVLDKVAGWLAPRGVLVVEEPALFFHDGSPYPAFRRLVGAFERYAALSHGADLRWARTLPAAVSARGLGDVGLAMDLQYVGEDGPGDRIWRVALGQARAGVIEAGLLTEAEFDEGMGLFDDPSFVDVMMALVSVWGSR